MEMQGHVGFISLMLFYTLSIPVASVFTFVIEMGVEGLILGIMTAYVFQCIVFFSIVQFTNLQKIIDEQAMRILEHSRFQSRKMSNIDYLNFIEFELDEDQSSLMDKGEESSGYYNYESSESDHNEGYPN
jgi:hypothetical protein